MIRLSIVDVVGCGGGEVNHLEERWMIIFRSFFVCNVENREKRRRTLRQRRVVEEVSISAMIVICDGVECPLLLLLLGSDDRDNVVGVG